MFLTWHVCRVLGTRGSDISSRAIRNHGDIKFRQRVSQWQACLFWLRQYQIAACEESKTAERSTSGNAPLTGEFVRCITEGVRYHREEGILPQRIRFLTLIMSFGGEPSKQFFERLRYYRRHKRLTPYSSQAHQNGMNVSMLLSAVLCSQESFGVLKC